MISQYFSINKCIRLDANSNLIVTDMPKRYLVGRSRFYLHYWLMRSIAEIGRAEGGR